MSKETRFLKSTVNGIVLKWTYNLSTLDHMVPCDKDGKALYVAVEENDIKPRTFDPPIELAPEDPEEEDETPDTPEEPENVPEKDLDSLSHDELKELAKEMKLDVDLRTNKYTLLNAIKEAQKD